MQSPRARLRFTTEDGTDLPAFHKATLKDSYIDPLGSVDVDFLPPEGQWQLYFDQLQKGQELRVRVDRANHGRWIIQEVKRKDGKSGRSIHVHCQNLLSAVYEANIPPDTTIKSDSAQPVRDVFLKILKPFGFKEVLVDDQAHVDALTGTPLPGGKTPQFHVKALKAKKATAHAGDSVYKFLSQITSYLGCVVKVDGEGNVLVIAPNYNQELAGSVGLGAGLGQFVDPFLDDVEVTDSNKGCFSEVNLIGQSDDDDRPKTGAIYAADVLPARCVYRSGLHEHKPIYHKDPHASDLKGARNAAALVLGSHAAHAYTVRGTVDGWYSATGYIWTAGTLVRCILPFESLDETMFLLSRELHFDVNDGDKTNLELIPKGALILGKEN